MNPYRLIHGTADDITSFENEICAALAEGFEFANRLITKVVENSNGQHKVLFFQPMVFVEALEFNYEDESGAETASNDNIN